VARLLLPEGAVLEVVAPEVGTVAGARLEAAIATACRADSVLFKGPFQPPDSFRQDDIRHQQPTRHAAVRCQQRVNALVLRRRVVEPKARQDADVKLRRGSPCARPRT
jgi:hypothetical protein